MSETVITHDPRPFTSGVGVFIKKDGLFLLGKRSMQCKRGPGCWALPGGIVEPGESLLGAVHREVFEETGMKVHVVPGGEFCPGVIGVSDHRPRENHLTYWVYVEWLSGEPTIMEPTKCDGWLWKDLRLVLDTMNITGEQANWIPPDAWRILITRMRLSPLSAVDVGMIVRPNAECRHRRRVLACGSGIYDDAVVASMQPFVLISREGDMRWDNKHDGDMEVVGRATPEMMAIVNRRLDLGR